MPGDQVDDEFRAAVKSYVDLHDQLQATAKTQRELRKQKTQLSDAILQYMQKNDIDGCKLSDGGKLIRKQSRRMEALKKEHILDELKKVVQDHTQCENVLVNIFSKRAVDTKDALKRTRTRGGGGDD
jgi:uncharacterized protein YdcH (DUF465 family)